MKAITFSTLLVRSSVEVFALVIRHLWNLFFLSLRQLKVSYLLANILCLRKNKYIHFSSCRFWTSSAHSTACSIAYRQNNNYRLASEEILHQWVSCMFSLSNLKEFCHKISTFYHQRRCPLPGNTEYNEGPSFHTVSGNCPRTFLPDIPPEGCSVIQYLGRRMW